MKTPRARLFTLIGITGAFAAAALLFRPAPPLETEAADPADVKPEWTKTANHDATAVFQRAFWRRPAADERILHAERIEWADPQNGVAKWQWFIAVEPGAEFKTWLREKNPFSLAAADSFQSPADTRHPAWFPASATSGDYEIHHGDTMCVLFARDGGRIYATASGHGFAPGLAGR